MAKATWTGTVTCGLVAVPVKMYTARTERRVKFNQMNSKTGNRVRQKRVDEKTGEEVAYEEIVSGYDMGNDRYVVLGAEELVDVEPKKSKEIQIEQFCRPEEIPSLAIKNAYYLGPNVGGGKSYRLLTDAMRRSGVDAVGRMVMRSVEYLVRLVVLEDGTLACEQLAFADEINPHEGLGVESSSEITDIEEQMAVQLVEAMTRPLEFEQLHDEYRLKVLELIERKAAGETVESKPQPEPEPAADLLAALEGSLAAVRSETPAKRPAKRARSKAAV